MTVSCYWVLFWNKLCCFLPIWKLMLQKAGNIWVEAGMSTDCHTLSVVARCDPVPCFLFGILLHVTAIYSISGWQRPEHTHATVQHTRIQRFGSGRDWRPELRSTKFFFFSFLLFFSCHARMRQRHHKGLFLARVKQINSHSSPTDVSTGADLSSLTCSVEAAQRDTAGFWVLGGGVADMTAQCNRSRC